LAKSDPARRERLSGPKDIFSPRDCNSVLGFGHDPAAAGRGRDPSRSFHEVALYVTPEEREASSREPKSAHLWTTKDELLFLDKSTFEPP
jgi:hypothetical protein